MRLAPQVNLAHVITSIVNLVVAHPDLYQYQYARLTPPALLLWLARREFDINGEAFSTVRDRNWIRANLHANAGNGGRSRRGAGSGTHSCIKGGGSGQDHGGGRGRHRGVVGCERGHPREMGS